MKVRNINPADDAAIAKLVRDNLKAHNLDIPGTVYFDSNLDHISDFYLKEPEKRRYFVVADESDRVVGGIGFAEFTPFEYCAELQKLYLSDEVKGQHLSYDLIRLVEAEAAKCGYRKLYLETHDNLTAAIHVYEKCAYKEIDKPREVVHGGMNRFFIKDL